MWLLGSILLLACQKPESADPVPPPAPLSPHLTHPFSSEIRAEDFAEMVQVLASDAFEGRAPGSRGETLTINYIRDQMQRIGLQPGNGDHWFQAVPITITTTDPATVITIDQQAQHHEWALGRDMVIGTRQAQPRIQIEHSEIVFVGYGVQAPEYDWNDYAQGEWQGKTVVMLVNDPGFHNHDLSLFEGRRMTWYGRWVYKFEEAARQGAAAALLIHDSAGAGYDWDVVQHSWGGAQFDLPFNPDDEPRLLAQGWLTQDAARTLFHHAGLDLEQLYRAASQPGFTPISLNAYLSLDLHSHIEASQSHNVIGVLPGSGRGDEAILYMAHWDHLGKHDDEPDAPIYNGAVDNTSGVAGILEIAAAMAAQPPPQRSVIFMATTLEEAGLLGSHYYIQHPTFPLNKIAAAINIDAMSVYGRARDVMVIGLGNTDMEEILEALAAKQGRYLREEEALHSGLYFRADHFSFARAGVPAIYPNGGLDLINGGRAAGRRAAEDYARNRYHSPFDEYDADTWKLDGLVQDLSLLHELGTVLANSDHWPQWYENSPFRARREIMRPNPLMIESVAD